MSDLPGSPGVDIDNLYARLGQMSDTATALRDSLAGETEAREAEVRLLERKQLTAQRAIDEANRASRRASHAAAAAIAAIVLGVIVSSILWSRLHHEVNQREADRVHAAVVSCENANTSRKLLVDYASQHTDDRINKLVDVVFSPEGATPEQAAQRQAFAAKIKADFAAQPTPIPDALLPRDCSVKAVTAPTTLTPSTIAPGQ